MAFDITHQSQSIFDTSDANVTGILPQQTTASSPTQVTLSTATGMILPDTTLQYRLRHMPDEIYDLRPTSHLVRFIKALSGESGVGQLRKRYMQSQFQSILAGTHFYDLDRFYGAIFHIQRRSDEVLEVDPMTDVATPDTWDAVAAADARYRERIISLAKAIALGATIPGLRAAAEALTGVPCEVYETWALLDSTGASPGANRTWDDMEATFATWAPMEDSTWQSIEGAVQYGRSGANTRGEVIIRPKKTYGADEVNLRIEDEGSIVRVLSVLKPAGVLLTVNSDGVPMHASVPIASVAADSEYWEVVTKIKPAPGLNGNPYTGASGGATPTPPLSGTQGTSWTYNQNITSVRSFSATRDAHWPADGSLGAWYMTTPPITSSNDIAIAANGVKTVYTPDKGVMDAKQAAAVRYAADGILTAAPYVGNRAPAVSAT